MAPPPAEARTMTVPELEKPERLDKFLVREFPHTSRAYWKDRLSETVRVNGRRAGKGDLLSGGETLAIDFVPPARRPTLRPNPELKIPVLHADPHLLAVDKPAGIPCYPLREDETRTVVQGVLAQYPEQGEVDPDSWEAGLINRLDNGTSGILLFSRSLEAKARLEKLNHAGEIQKEYLAWVEGVVTEPGAIRTPIAHHPKNKRKMILPQDEAEAKKFKARPALTEYEVVKTTERHSLLRVILTKGNRHQIRIHLASLGHPVVGDALYGKKTDGPERNYLLHAHRVHFRHPFTQQKLTLTAPVPGDFAP